MLQLLLQEEKSDIVLDHGLNTKKQKASMGELEMHWQW